MNIALVRHSIQNRGSDKALFTYADHLIRQGHTIFYYTNEIKTSVPYNSRINFCSIPHKGKEGTVFFSLTHTFTEDVVCFDLIGLSILGWIKNKKKLVYLARGFDVDYYSNPLMRALIHFAYGLGLNVFGIPTITASEALTDKLSRFRPKKILTATNGVNTKFFAPGPTAQHFIRSGEEVIILLYVRKEYVKGLDTAQAALKHLSEINPTGWKIWTIGEKWESQDPRITNHGFLNEDKLRDILGTADIFLLPSRSEGLSPMLLQALSCGCAVVATEAANILTHGENGLVSPVNDAVALAKNINQVITDQDLREKLRTNARILAEHYSLEKSCREFEAALLQITNAARSSPRPS